MTATSSPRTVSSRRLLYAAAALAYVVAGVHLFHPSHGFGRLVTLLLVDPSLLVTDPRPVAFVLSGLAVLVGVPAVVAGFPRRAAYALGAGLAATYLVGYFAWHLSGHGGFLPGRKPLYHGMTPVEAVVAHLTGEPLAAVAVVTELAFLSVLVVLYRRDA
ncbi:MAG: hypothetical protein ABEJ34_03370 [Haloferacaceae archaeon]